MSQHTGEHPMPEFTRGRLRAEQELAEQRDKAVRTVARHANDPQEFAGLLSMLGLVDEPDDPTDPITRGGGRPAGDARLRDGT